MYWILLGVMLRHLYEGVRDAVMRLIDPSWGDDD
jgi:hypothetical protein